VVADFGVTPPNRSILFDFNGFDMALQVLRTAAANRFP
jgi:hypothetical protein